MERSAATRGRGVVDPVADHRRLQPFFPKLLDEHRFFAGKPSAVAFMNANRPADLQGCPRLISRDQGNPVSPLIQCPDGLLRSRPNPVAKNKHRSKTTPAGHIHPGLIILGQLQNALPIPGPRGQSQGSRSVPPARAICRTSRFRGTSATLHPPQQALPPRKTGGFPRPGSARKSSPGPPPAKAPPPAETARMR